MPKSYYILQLYNEEFFVSIVFLFNFHDKAKTVICKLICIIKAYDNLHPVICKCIFLNLSSAYV